jgi:DNA invertase Pin-like site-specific DNA recombinase
MPDDAPPPSAETVPPVRCAIYARVSVADAERPGLTSIQVQVEACAQFIASRRGMGWIQSGPAYIDDGVSAATLQRPGLRALLADIRQDKIDVVVVHRLDRLSRSLFDLSDLLPLFTVQGVELVSVTQPIDTHTPNGRLSLVRRHRKLTPWRHEELTPSYARR